MTLAPALIARAFLGRQAPGAAGLYPQEVLRASWGPRSRCPAAAGAGEERA